MTSSGVLLFAHGSRDPAWRAPFDAILAAVTARHTGPVGLAFLEHTTPGFHASVTGLIDQGVSDIRVVPLFLAAGGHVRSCLPALVGEAQGKYSSVRFSVLPPLGESAVLIRAFADFALQPI